LGFICIKFETKQTPTIFYQFVAQNGDVAQKNWHTNFGLVTNQIQLPMPWGNFQFFFKSTTIESN